MAAAPYWMVVALHLDSLMAGFERFGRGLTFPLQRDGRGDFANASGREKFRNNLALILGTRGGTERLPGEVPWRPEFGGQLFLLKHEPANERTRALARFYVVDAFGRFEPRARVLDARIETIEDDAGTTLEITVVYETIESRGATGVAESITIRI